MIEPISEKIWDRYSDMLPRNRKIHEPVLPSNLTYQGKINGEFDYVPCKEILKCLREWMDERDETYVYYFLTESVQEEHTDFKIFTSSLNKQCLFEINKGSENVIVGRDFSWAIFIDQMGSIHVSGSKELFYKLNYCVNTANF